MQRNFWCFNWATPVKAWKVYQTILEESFPSQLQLGHAGEGVESTKSGQHGLLQPELQLGHAGEGVESVLADRHRIQQYRASIGPRR